MLHIGLSRGRVTFGNQRQDQLNLVANQDLETSVFRLSPAPLNLSGQLRHLQLGVYCPELLLQSIARQSPLLKSVRFPSNCTDDDIFVVATECRSLEHVEFHHRFPVPQAVSVKGLSHLCRAKNIRTIEASGLERLFTNKEVLTKWATELPKLRTVRWHGIRQKKLLELFRESVRNPSRPLGQVDESWLDKFVRTASDAGEVDSYAEAYLHMFALREDILKNE